MRRTVATFFGLVLMTQFAVAGTDCTTRKSGSVTITTCTDARAKPSFVQCRSYMSGSVRKTSCRS
jgi:hypothetical protein